MQLLSPSLFGGRRLVLLRSAQDLPAARSRRAAATAEADPDCAVVVQHLGGGQGQGGAGGGSQGGAVEISCAKLTRPRSGRLPAQRGAPVRRLDHRRRGRALLDAVGSDLREISAVTAQLVGDTGGTDRRRRRRRLPPGPGRGHRIRGGRPGGRRQRGRRADEPALGAEGRGAAVVIADAMADGVRTVARVLGAGPGIRSGWRRRSGMPPWKVKRARGQSRGWTEPGCVRRWAWWPTLNADVKGTAADPDYALESAVRKMPPPERSRSSALESAFDSLRTA